LHKKSSGSQHSPKKGYPYQYRKSHSQGSRPHPQRSHDRASQGSYHTRDLRNGSYEDQARHRGNHHSKKSKGSAMEEHRKIKKLTGPRGGSQRSSRKSYSNDDSYNSACPDLTSTSTSTSTSSTSSGGTSTSSGYSSSSSSEKEFHPPSASSLTFVFTSGLFTTANTHFTLLLTPGHSNLLVSTTPTNQQLQNLSFPLLSDSSIQDLLLSIGSVQAPSAQGIQYTIVPAIYYWTPNPRGGAQIPHYTLLTLKEPNNVPFLVRPSTTFAVQAFSIGGNNRCQKKKPPLSRELPRGTNLVLAFNFATTSPTILPSISWSLSAQLALQ